ncbi:hypothetical protein [Lewinella sp.]|uniref:hypothetical protein n=1 Tax=Lewinella sp. TaxID=2004506 RepID=UPI003D6BF9FB
MKPICVCVFVVFSKIELKIISGHSQPDYQSCYPNYYRNYSYHLTTHSYSTNYLLNFGFIEFFTYRLSYYHGNERL